MFNIKTITDLYKKDVYCVFVDFKKAFDSVIPSLLLYKLQQNNVKGLTYNVIKDICNYSN